MSSLIRQSLVFAYLFFLTLNAHAAGSVELQSLSDCMRAMGYNLTGNQGDHIFLPVAPDQMLVLNSNGAKIVRSSATEFGDATYVYTPPGQTEMMKSYQSGIAFFNIKNEKADPTKDLTAAEARVFAGRILKSEKSKPDSSMNHLDQWLRSHYEQSPDGFTTKRNMGGRIDPDRLRSKMDKVSRSLSRLSSCDRVANDDIKSAASMEKNRLAKLQDRLNSYANRLDESDDNDHESTTETHSHGSTEAAH